MTSGTVLRGPRYVRSQGTRGQHHALVAGAETDNAEHEAAEEAEENYSDVPWSQSD